MEVVRSPLHGAEWTVYHVMNRVHISVGPVSLPPLTPDEAEQLASAIQSELNYLAHRGASKNRKVAPDA